ncbi:MAG: hypothetical protein OZ921_21250, partial [Sorangiineae bacterium]|nr:hypothetical protein [Sorangiineae bacterium]
TRRPSRRPRNRSPRYPSNPALALIANPRFRVIVSSRDDGRRPEEPSRDRVAQGVPERPERPNRVLISEADMTLTAELLQRHESVLS